MCLHVPVCLSVCTSVWGQMRMEENMCAYMYMCVCKLLCARVDESVSECVCTHLCVSDEGVCVHMWGRHVWVSVYACMCVLSPLTDNGPIRGRDYSVLSPPLPNLKVNTPMLMQMALFHSFDGWKIFHCIYVPHLLCPFLCWWTFMWSWLLYIVLLWTLGCMYLFELWFSLDICPWVGLLDHIVTLFLVF